MANKIKYKFCVYCSNLKEVMKKVELLGYTLCVVTTPDVDKLRHRFGCIGKSRTVEEDYAILNEIEGIDIVSWSKINQENNNG